MKEKIKPGIKFINQKNMKLNFKNTRPFMSVPGKNHRAGDFAIWNGMPNVMGIYSLRETDAEELMKNLWEVPELLMIALESAKKNGVIQDYKINNKIIKDIKDREIELARPRIIRERKLEQIKTNDKLTFLKEKAKQLGMETNETETFEELKAKVEELEFKYDYLVKCSDELKIDLSSSKVTGLTRNAFVNSVEEYMLKVNEDFKGSFIEQVEHYIANKDIATNTEETNTEESITEEQQEETVEQVVETTTEEVVEETEE